MPGKEIFVSEKILTGNSYFDIAIAWGKSNL